ncbi:restriction endonuclease [Deinococcus sp. KSM4-11]|uniref:restriction endonuclease n=1 Tax=Deinococcus sp. KSM4-11 TaxID=2568654 RepID=UPI0021081A0B|nr:restriction endonuclease [Deinococcus sp. KSM4-11]
MGTLSPREFELHVARVLGALPGWSAQATRSAGDQGADVIAQGPDGVKLAVQVKHHRQAVGNKAVQEIVASKAFYQCTHAVVVTSGPGYTRAAQELAKANGVPLWDAKMLFLLQECALQQRPVPQKLLLP